MSVSSSASVWFRRTFTGTVGIGFTVSVRFRSRLFIFRFSTSVSGAVTVL